MMLCTVTAFQYIGQNTLCITNSSNNQTCLNQSDSYSMGNNQSYIINTFDKQQSPSGAHAYDLAVKILTILSGVALIFVVFIILGFIFPKE